MKFKIIYIEAVLALLSIALCIPLLRDSVGGRNNRKAVLKAESNPQEARALLNKALRCNPSNPIYHLNFGLLNASCQNGMSIETILQHRIVSIPDSTIVAFENAVAFSDKEPIPLLNLAFVRAFDGEYEEACNMLEPLVEQNFCWEPVRIFYGILLERQGRRESAQQAFTEAVTQTPIILESQFFSDLSERDPAMAHSVAADARYSVLQEYAKTGNPLKTAVLGEIEFIMGDVEDAGTHLKEALAALPSMNRPWLFLGRIAELEEDRGSALSCYKKAAQLDEYDALPVYFKARAEGKASIVAEQMQSLLSLEQKLDLYGRYGAAVMTEPLAVVDFERYCTYDYVKEIERDRYSSNSNILNDILSSIGFVYDTDSPLGDITASIAEKMLGTPYEAGLLDVYPERLRVYLDKTDNLHFIEACMAVALTYKGESIGEYGEVNESEYDQLCENIKALRYRDGIISKFSDRIFYFSEWVEQAERLGLIEEYTDCYGHEYSQNFSYLSDHLMYLPQIGREPNARKEILEIEKRLSANSQRAVISPEELTTEFYECVQNGDIVSFLSDRKGEDVSKAGIVRKTQNSVQIISASYKERTVVSEDLKKSVADCKGIRIFRVL